LDIVYFSHSYDNVCIFVYSFISCNFMRENQNGVRESVKTDNPFFPW